MKKKFKTKLDYYIYMKFETARDFLDAFHEYAKEHGIETKINRNNVYLWRIGKCFPEGHNRTIISAVLEEDQKALFPMDKFLEKGLQS